jgi:hypothetical protein
MRAIQPLSFGFADQPRLVDDYGREYLAPEATREVVAAYPSPIRNWISRHGGLRQRLIFCWPSADKDVCNCLLFPALIFRHWSLADLRTVLG